MNLFKDKKFKSNIMLASYVIILAYIFLNLDTVGKGILNVLSVLKPFIIGIAIAFVLNLPMKFFESTIFSKFCKRYKKLDATRFRRPLSLLFTIIVIIGVIFGVTLFVIPQLIDSGSTLVKNVPKYVNSLQDILSKYNTKSTVVQNIYDQAVAAGKEIITFVGSLTTTILGRVVDITVGVTSTIINFVIAFIVSIYILLSKEKLILQIKKLMYAFINEDSVTKILKLGRLVNNKFSRFVAGQCLEACILGFLCFIGMTIFKMPYALLIGTLIGVTALIPIVGAIIGLIPSTIILLTINPMTALWFVVLVIVIQQIEGNLIYPFVVGNSIGLSALWVLFAITVGGNTFGIMGMLIGVPLFGVIYTLLSYYTNKRLENRNIVLDACEDTKIDTLEEKPNE